jgi:hypothetical protein
MYIGTILLSLLIIYIILTIVELVGLYRFNLNYYDRGFKIYKREIACTFSNWRDLDGVYDGKEGSYVFLPEMGMGYFITKYSFYTRNGLWSYYTIPMTIFGRFEEVDKQLEITYFISYRLVFLLSIWLILCTLLPIIAGLFTGNWIAFVIALCGGSLSFLIVYIVHTFQQGRRLIMSDEIASLLKIRNRNI